MNAKPQGIPGSRGTHHVGYTVPDLDQAVAFFVDVLGAEVSYRLGPLKFPGEWAEQQLNVHPETSMKVAMVRMDPMANFELFEYSAPDQNRNMPRNSDWGGHHVAIYVEDMDEAVAYLRAQPGVRVLGEPQPLQFESTQGDSWVYFLSPWGMQFELIRMPLGMSYEQALDTRLFQPGGW